MINDVKYDIDNDCYIACGYINNNGMGALIISFDNTGMINWKTSGYDFTAQRGASEYRRVEICTLHPDTTIYAVCGYGYNGVYEKGITAFYDETGNLLSMYKSIVPNVYKTKYNDLVYNPESRHLGLTGTFIDDVVYSGYIYHEYNISLPQPYPINTVIRRNYPVDATAITYEPVSSMYFISGSNVNTGELFLCQTDLTNPNTLDYFYPTNNINIADISVSDNCINYTYYRLGVTGYCTDPNGMKEGFMADIDLNTANFPILDFSKWSGNNPPYALPFNDAYFQHIIFRDNMAITPNYSYILYGLPQNPLMPFSYISEYYPDYTYWHCSDKSFNVNLLPQSQFNSFPDTIISAPATDVFPDFHISYPYQTIQYECNNPPIFSMISNSQKQKQNLNFNNPVLKMENGLMVLNEEYKNVICNIFNTNGQLIGVKEKGKQIINTTSYILGIYLLNPMGISNLKSIKFIIK